VGISIGVTLFPNDACGAEDLLKHADMALYLAKAKGKGRVWTYGAT
jgi:predicted signal transduction protein with EAL and GGDEF domain